MIEIDKIQTSNPYVDNVIYYAKLLALNCTVKDQEQALSNETLESKRAGDIYLSCVKGVAKYEIFENFPKEILGKYITQKSNLDMYVDSNNALRTYLNDLTSSEKIDLEYNISELARTVYMDHYNIMTDYIRSLGTDWFDSYAELNSKCEQFTATYDDLFYILPKYTRDRIIKHYINNYDNTNFDDILESKESFNEYISNRTDSNISVEVNNINHAMCSVFSSHYQMMIERDYFRKDTDHWLEYNTVELIMNKCKANASSYSELYPLIPAEDRKEALYASITNTSDIDTYNLNDDLSILEDYFTNVSNNAEIEKTNLTDYMTKLYLNNYNPMMNNQIYSYCVTEEYDYWDLANILPRETKKMILNAFIEEYTNLEVFAKSKNMLNNYLSSLPKEEADNIKTNITSDMTKWYIDNYVEKNNYYRAFIGLPPMTSNGEVLNDTLEKTYSTGTKSYISFGNKYLSMIPDTIYPESHWSQPIYKFDSYDISILKEYGILDAYIEDCIKNNIYDITDRYKYFNYLGDEKLDLFTCRSASAFGLIGIPTIDDLDAKDSFIDNYNINKDYVLRTVYDEAYKFQSDYYDKFIIIFILINTIMDMLTDIPEYIIDRRVFDSRCIKYLFESFGIPYYSEIPIKYQRAMVKNLNTLIKYKSSTKNMIDICSLFGFNDVKVFNYYLFKTRNTTDDTGEYIFEENNDINYSKDILFIKDPIGDYVDYNGIHFSKITDIDNDKYFKQITVKDSDGNTHTTEVMDNTIDFYIQDPDDSENFILYRDMDYFTKIKANTEACDLKFIKVPIGETITNYKNDNDYISTYDDIVNADEGDTWNDGDGYDAVKQKILDYNFNAVRSKYISIETVTEMTELAFQVSYFYNMLFDNFYSEDNLTVELPHLKSGHKFRFMDIICYLFALTYYYNGIKDKIMYSPTQILYIKGYNFNEALNEVLKDETAFQQTDPEDGSELSDSDKYNIFSINDRIAEDNYDYQEAFEPYRILSFNLNADIDQIEKYLVDNYQMSLSDFVVDDSLTEFNQIITLRQFFSLNNSYYQKSIFKDNLIPLAYNQDIKYAYNYDLFRISYTNDHNGNNHMIISVDGEKIEIINDKADYIYILDHNKTITFGNKKYSYYKKWLKNDDKYVLESNQPYIYDNDEYKLLFDNAIYIRNSDKEYIFGADNFYKRNNSGEYELIEDEKYFISDDNYKILLYGEYYILENGVWKLNHDNCYVKVLINNEVIYMLASEAEDIENPVISESDCFILHSDGHFVRLSDTDYFVRSNNDDFIFNEEDCYKLSDNNMETEYYDPSVNPRVYYEKLSDYYSENSYNIVGSSYYVKDVNGNYIQEDDLINPNNCYYIDSSNNYILVSNVLAKYNEDSLFNTINNVLILQNNNNYNKYYMHDDSTYKLNNEENKLYVYNSDPRFILRFNLDDTYSNTNFIIISFNKYLDSNTYNDEQSNQSKYNPENTDNVWDENDWFYEDSELSLLNDNNPIGMNGENIWYYRNPDGSSTSTEEESINETIGSGFYFESTAYVGDILFEEGEKYYMSFDIETNWNGRMQICNDADSECNSSADRVYDIVKDTNIHINQIFIANANTTPSIKLLIYNYDTNPILIGNYVVIKNIKIVKSYSDNFISQDITSYDMLQEIYKTNDKIYKYLIKLMSNTSDYRTYEALKYLYDSLMTSKYNKEAFKLDDNKYAETFTEFLENRDSVLYNKLLYYLTLDEDAMHKQIADDIVEITYAIDDCIDTYNYGYLYSYFPAVSVSYIQQYISKIIEFFKSWKVHLSGINTVYKLDSELDNRIKILEDLEQYSRLDDEKQNAYIYDSLKINPVDGVNPQGYKYSDLFGDEWSNITHRFYDDCRPRDSIRIMARYEDSIQYTKDHEEMHIILADSEAKEENGELIINSSSAGFREENGNELIIDTEYSNQKLFDSQFFGEINHNSTDILGG